MNTIVQSVEYKVWIPTKTKSKIITSAQSIIIISKKLLLADLSIIKVLMCNCECVSVWVCECIRFWFRGQITMSWITLKCRLLYCIGQHCGERKSKKAQHFPEKCQLFCKLSTSHGRAESFVYLLWPQSPAPSPFRQSTPLIRHWAHVTLYVTLKTVNCWQANQKQSRATVATAVATNISWSKSSVQLSSVFKLSKNNKHFAHRQTYLCI